MPDTNFSSGTSWKNLIARLSKKATKAERTQWIATVLQKISYASMTREEKGEVCAYLQSETGYSRATVMRQISAYTDALRAATLAETNVPEPETPIAKNISANKKSLTPGRFSTAIRTHKRHAVPLAIACMLCIVAVRSARDTQGLRAELTASERRMESVIAASAAARKQAAADEGHMTTSADPVIFEPEHTAKAETQSRMIEARRDRLITRLQLHGSAPSGATQGVITASTSALTNFLAGGREGQVLMIVNGKPVWRDFPGLYAGGQATASDTGGRNPNYRGGGGTQPSVTVTQVPHDHQNDAGGGVLNILTATQGILPSTRGGTGFASFSTGDLLVGNSGQGLSKLSLGAAGYVLTSSGGTALWASPGSIAAAGGWVDDGVVVRLSTLSDQVAIGKTNATAALDVMGTISGSQIIASSALRSSGSLIVDAVVTFKSLTGCINLQSAADGTLSCNNTVYQTQILSDARYVNTSGDTMTGALAIHVSNPNTVALNVNGTMSGRSLYITGTGSAPLLVADRGTGNVGIGTSSPGAKLHVTGGNMFLDGNTGIFTWGTSPSAPELRIGFVNDNTVGNYIKTADSGNRSLDIGSRSDGYIAFNQVSAGTSGNNQEVRFYGYSGKTGDTGGKYGFLKLNDGGVSAFSYLSLETQGSSYPLVFQPSGGNVGIGKTSPSTKLDVVGTISGSALTISSLSGCSALQSSTNGTFSCATGLTTASLDARYVNTSGDTMTGALSIRPANPNTVALNVSGTMSGRSLYVSGTGATPLLMTDRTTGRVGIGTSSPTAVLEVYGGNIHNGGTGMYTWGGGASAPLLTIGFVNDNTVGNYIKTSGPGNDSLDIGSKNTGNVYFHQVSSGTPGNNQAVVFNGYSSKTGDTGGKYGFITLNDGGTSAYSYLSLQTQGSNYPLVFQPSGGNVGIGKTAPATKLDVVGTISGSALTTSNPSGTNYMMGSLGIGTSSPSQLLEVSKSQNDGTSIQVTNSSTGGSAFAGILANNGAGILGITVRSQSYTDAPSLANMGVLRTDTTLSGMVLATGGARPIIFQANDTEAMRITSAGNVGIGTSSPSVPLHVAGDSGLRVEETGQTGRYITFTPPTGGGARATMLSSSIVGMDVGVSVAGPLNFVTDNSIRLTVDSAGDVGIGKSAPSAKLDVVGTISGSALVINGTSFINTGSGSKINALSLINPSGTNASASVALTLGRSAGHVMGEVVASNQTNGTFTNGYLAFGTRTSEVVTEKMRILSSGFVGMGTSSPTSNLDIRGAYTAPTSAVAGNLRILSTDAAGTAGVGGSLSLGGNAANANRNAATLLGANESTSGDRGYLAIYTNGTGIGNGYGERVRIDSNGTFYANSVANNITTVPGIVVFASANQTANVQEWKNSSSAVMASMSQSGWLALNRTGKAKTALEVQGTISGSALRINGNASFGYRGAGATGWLTLNDTGGSNGSMQFNGIGSVDAVGDFFFRNNPATVVYMTVKATTGNIGIGKTQSPGAKLSVSGSVVIGNNIDSRAAKAQLDVVGTISGSALTISNPSGTNYLMGTLGIGASSPQSTLQISAPYINQYMSNTGKFAVYEGKVIFSPAAQSSANINLDALDLIHSKTGAHAGGSLNINFKSYDNGNSINRGIVAQVTGGQNGDLASAGYGFLTFGTANPLATTSTERMRINSAGNVGIGTTAPTERLTASGAIGIDADQTNASSNLFSITSNAGSTNNLVFRIQADGSSFSDNAHSTAGADYAEWFETTETTLKPGDIVCIDVTRSNSVKKCSSDGDTNVMGIISTNPSVIGNAVKGKTITAEGFGRPGYALVGLIGQIPAKAKVDTINTASGAAIESIRPGDSLAAGSTPGTVRRARAGESTVGVALEGLLTGEGTIKVLIARSNKSITTEVMEEKVRQNIAALKIDDEIALSLQKELEGLNLEQTVKDLTDEDIVRLEETINTLKAQITSLSGSIIQANSTNTWNNAMSGTAVVDSLTANSTLTVVSHTRIGGDLYLEGALKVNSIFVPGGMRVDGGMEVGGTLTADKIIAGSGSQITGLLKINDAILSSSGAALTADQLFVKGAMEVLGDITIRGIAKFFGNVEIHGELIVSAKQAGSAKIAAGSTSVTVLFQSGGFVSSPVITATSNDFAPWRMTHKSQTGFTLEVQAPLDHDITFDWHALGTFNLQSAAGDAEVVPTIPFPIDSLGVPLSTNTVWNNCIRSIPTFAEDGQPLSCSRYVNGNEWEHPDLMIKFVWNTTLTPALLQLPEGYTATITETVSSSSSSSSESSTLSEVSSSSESSVNSSFSSETSSSSVSSEASSSSVSSSSSTSSSSSSEAPASVVEPEPTPEPEVTAPAPMGMMGPQPGMPPVPTSGN